MAGLSQTETMRNTASRFIMAAACCAAEEDSFTDPIQSAFLELCQDTDRVIRSLMLSNMYLVMKKLDKLTVQKLLFPEVFF